MDGLDKVRFGDNRQRLPKKSLRLTDCYVCVFDCRLCVTSGTFEKLRFLYVCCLRTHLVKLHFTLQLIDIFSRMLTSTFH